MVTEYQSPQSQTTVIESPYPYAAILDHTSGRSRSALSEPAKFFRYRILKRSIDVALVLAFAPVILPVVLFVAAIVKLSSKGPVFYSHRRIGKDGAFFSMWKFRTMCVDSAGLLEKYLEQNPDARTEWNKTHKLRNDPRVTRIGSLLRRYSLDELPQLWNVLNGQMSLVGPRPIVAAEVEKYGDCFDCYRSVVPGLTGIWQVSGRSELSYDARVTLDCEYVGGWSLRRDILILMKTFSSVVNQDGAF